MSALTRKATRGELFFKSLLEIYISPSSCPKCFLSSRGGDDGQLDGAQLDFMAGQLAAVIN